MTGIVSGIVDAVLGRTANSAGSWRCPHQEVPPRAQTGGALVILGSVVLCVGLFLADSCFPPVILGVIVLFGGLELAACGRGVASTKEERYIVYLTAGLALWNMGVAYCIGLLLAIACERRRVRL